MGAYQLVRVALRLAGNLTTFAGVAIVLLFASGLHGQLLDALPAMFMWYLALGACRWLARLLPAPPVASQVPRDDPLPPAAVAVNITPIAPAAACPDLIAMKERLPPGIARLVK